MIKGRVKMGPARRSATITKGSAKREHAGLNASGAKDRVKMGPARRSASCSMCTQL